MFRRMWFEKLGVRKIEGGKKSRFYNNQESKQKYHGTLVQFLASFEWSHIRILLTSQKLEPPRQHDKQQLQESQAEWDHSTERH